MHKHSKIVSVGLAASLLGSTALTTVATAMAQEVEGADDKGDVIIVTSSRREQNILDVPYNISSISGDDIEAARILEPAELLRSIPGVSTIDRGQRNAGTLNAARIRGLSVEGGGQGDVALSAVATVSTYVNDTPIFANLRLLDLERVEVLRGPQGTLYGSGSLGGTIKYVTRDPVFGEMAGYAAVSASHVDGSDSIGFDYEGMVNLPIGENAALRIVGSVSDFPGITDYVNVYTLDENGIPVAPNGVLDPAAVFESVEDADTFESWTGRATFRWEPTDNFDVRMVHTRQSDEVGGRRQVTRGVDGFGEAYGEYENGAIQLEPSSRDVNATSLEMNLDLGFATLTSSSSHYDHTGESISENTGFFAQAGFLSFYYNYPRPMARADRSYADEAVVQEIRLVSNEGGQFDYAVGAFYRKQQLQSTQDGFVVGFQNFYNEFLPAFANLVDGDQDFIYNRVENFEELALFGELTWHLSDRWSVTGGFRAFDNEAENNTVIGSGVFSTFVNPVSDPLNVDFEISEDDILFKGTVAYEPTQDSLVYATISEGFRRGGTTAVPLVGMFAEAPEWQIYDADTVVNYEVGWKGSYNGLRYDLNLFYIDWQDPQLNTSTPNFGFFSVANGDSARTQGVEAQLSGTWDVGTGLNYQFGYAYVDAELTGEFLSPDPAALFALAPDGATLPGTPEHAFNWVFDYTFDINSDWTLFARLDGAYQSETQNSVGTSPLFAQEFDGFAISNGVLTATQGNVSASLWMRNIFNEEGVTGAFTEEFMGTAPDQGFFGNASKDLIALPRTVGFTVRLDF